MVAGIGIRQNGSALAVQTNPQNFCPQKSAQLTTSGSSSSITFSGVTGTLRQTFLITNSGTANGAYLGWGHTTATAVASSGTPAANCLFIGPGETLTLDFQLSTGIVDTIAAIQSGGATTLEITVGSGQ